MRRVANTLKGHTLTETDKALQRLYAQSTYNRYYYACYYLSAEEIYKILNVWEDRHSEVLNRIKRDFKPNLEGKINSSPLPSSEKVNLITLLQNSTNTWHDTLKLLKKAREAADYKKTTSFTINAGEIKMKYGHKSMTSTDADNYIATLLGVFKVLDMIYKKLGIK